MIKTRQYCVLCSWGETYTDDGDDYVGLEHRVVCSLARHYLLTHSKLSIQKRRDDVNNRDVIILTTHGTKGPQSPHTHQLLTKVFAATLKKLLDASLH